MSEALPPEILARILVLSRSTKRAQHIAPFELTLSCVSQWWRAVATNSPELWDTIEIYTPRSLERVPMYLERSGSWPLCLQVDVYNYEAKRGNVFPDKPFAVLGAFFVDVSPRPRTPPTLESHPKKFYTRTGYSQDLIYLSIHDYFPRDWPTDHDVRPDSRVTLLAAQEVIAEDGFDELLEGVRNRIDEIESLHRTREVTFKDLGDGDKIRLSVDKSGGETLRTLWGPPS